MCICVWTHGNLLDEGKCSQEDLREATDIVDILKLFFSKEFVGQIVAETNSMLNTSYLIMCLVSVCLFFVGKMKGIAFIKDPDGYWIEILSPVGMRKLLE